MIISNDMIYGLLLAIIGGVIVLFIGWLSRTISGRIVNRTEFEYEWTPEERIINSKDDLKMISNYPKNPKMEFNEDGLEIALEKGRTLMIEGMESFQQSLIKFINTEKDRYEIYKNTEYGISYIFQSINTKEEFNKVSQSVALEIVKFFDEWVKEIHFIKKYKKKEKIQIGLGVKGENQIIKIDIPLLKLN